MLRGPNTRTRTYLAGDVLGLDTKIKLDLPRNSPSTPIQQPQHRQHLPQARR
jgi:hypothetical protein